MYDGMPNTPYGGFYIRGCVIEGGGSDICRAYMQNRNPGQGKVFELVMYYPSDTIIYQYEWQINTWYCVDVWFKEHASTGFYKMYVNNVKIIDTGNINTSGASTVDKVSIGAEYWLNWGGGSGDFNAYWDCVCIMDTGPIGTHDRERVANLETGDLSEFDGLANSPELSTDMHCGDYSMKCDPAASTYEGGYFNVGHNKEIYCQFEVKFSEISSLSSGDYLYFAYFRESTDSINILQLFITNESGTIKWGYTYRTAGSTSTVTEDTVSTGASDDVWYCVKVYVKCTSKDGDSEGEYKMYVDGSLCDDIDVSSVDTDYTGISIVRLYSYSTIAGGITQYYDCVDFGTSDVSACHVGEGTPPTPEESLESELDCTIPESSDWVQVYINCERVYIEGFNVESAERGAGKITIPYLYPVVRGDVVHVVIQGERILQGKVTAINKERSKGIKTLTCQVKSARLYGRYILNKGYSAWSDEDVGQIAKEILDYYFNGLFTTNNVDTNIGTTISNIECYDKSVGDATDELCHRGNATLYIDKDNDVHMFRYGSEPTGFTFNKKNICSPISKEDIGEPIGKVIVKGAAGISGEAGSGLPEYLHSDRRISTNIEATEVAEVLLADYGQITNISFTVVGFYSIRKGQTAILDMPLDGYDNETITAHKVSWTVSAGKVFTHISIGKLPLTWENMITQVHREIQEQKVNRISDHSGNDTGDGDPVLEYTEILATGLGTSTRIQTSEVQLQSGACSSEPDAANHAIILVHIERQSGWGDIFWTIENTTTGEEYLTEWSRYSASPFEDLYFRCVVLDDLSGDTIRVLGAGAGTSDGYVKAEITVRQVLKHRHDITQAVEHEFD
jgi:hypothetical protein